MKSAPGRGSRGVGATGTACVRHVDPQRVGRWTRTGSDTHAERLPSARGSCDGVLGGRPADEALYRQCFACGVRTFLACRDDAGPRSQRRARGRRRRDVPCRAAQLVAAPQVHDRGADCRRPSLRPCGSRSDERWATPPSAARPPPGLPNGPATMGPGGSSPGWRTSTTRTMRPPLAASPPPTPSRHAPVRPVTTGRERPHVPRGGPPSSRRRSSVPRAPAAGRGQLGARRPARPRPARCLHDVHATRRGPYAQSWTASPGLTPGC